MTDIAGQRKMIQEEEVDFRSPFSESLMQRMGAAINHINVYQYDTRKIALDGSYSVASVPQTGVEGLEAFPFGIQLFDVCMWNMVAGSSGTTELDIKAASSSGGTFTSIFSTTPKIASSAGNNSYFLKSIGAGAGQTAPVFNTTDFAATADGIFIPAGYALRTDLIQKQGGAPENCGITIFFRPA